MPPLSLLETLRHSSQSVMSVNGNRSTEVEVSFKNNTLRIKTYKGWHYFENIEQLIVHDNKVECVDLSGKATLLELGIFKQPNFGVPDGYHGCRTSALVKTLRNA